MEVATSTDAAAALREGNYATAIRLYARLIAEAPEREALLGFNLSLARRRYRAARQAEPLHVGVCGWRMSDNSAGRAQVLADLYGENVEMFGALYKEWGEEIWPPLRNTPHPYHLLKLKKRASFSTQAFEFVLEHPYDLVHISKPRMLNMIFGLLYKLLWGAQVIVDVDDEDLGGIGATSPAGLETLPQGPNGRVKFEMIGGKEATRVGIGLWDIFDGVTVSNSALQQRYGGVILPHARPADLFRPSPERKRASRERFGIPQNKTVVLFLGTARRHKGVTDTAQALSRLGRSDICFVIAGDIPERNLRKELEAIEGLDMRFLPAQSYDDLGNVVAMGDICVLLQNPESLLAQYQLPAKLVDALAMKLLVLAQPTLGLQELIKRGAVVATSPKELGSTLESYIQAPARAAAVTAVGRRYFLDFCTVDACRRQLVDAFGSSQPSLPRLDRMLDSRRQVELFNHIGGWHAWAPPSSSSLLSRAAQQVVHTTVPDNEGTENAHLELFRQGRWGSFLREWTAFPADCALVSTANYKSYLRRAYHNYASSTSRFLSPSTLNAAVEGSVALRTWKLEDAAVHWKDYTSAALKSPENKIRYTWYLNRNKEIFCSIRRSPARPLQNTRRYVVYTALFGDYDILRPPLYRPENVDFVCFSDRPRNAPGWQIRVVPPITVNGQPDFFLSNRYYKILCHKHFRTYDGSIYIDANQAIVGDLEELICSWLSPHDFVGWSHPDRSDVYDELEAILVNSRASYRYALEELKFMMQNKMPRHTGLLEAAFLWRTHNSSEVNQFMEAWWKHVERFCGRDQPALAFTMWHRKYLPKIMPERVGNTRLNDFTVKLKHLDALRKTSPPQRGVSQVTRTPAPRPRALRFIYHSDYEYSGSVVMRAKQSAEILRTRFGVDARAVSQEHLGDIKDAILILNKAFLKKCSAEALSLLRKAGNIVCGDFVDDPPRKDLLELMDGLVAASVGQFMYYAENYPFIASQMITHHVDPRLPDVNFSSKRPKIAYFGELVNAKFVEELRSRVDFVNVDTKRADDGQPEWLGQLKQFNVHYAVRSRREIDGFKPFLKGFTSAHCKANMIVPLTEGDARHYLTSSYPYILEDDGIDSVIEMIDKVEATVGSREWVDALEIMRSIKDRSSWSWINSEYKSMLALLGVDAALL